MFLNVFCIIRIFLVLQSGVREIINYVEQGGCTGWGINLQNVSISLKLFPEASTLNVFFSALHNILAFVLYRRHGCFAQGVALQS